jgi:hypothetical protein
LTATSAPSLRTVTFGSPDGAAWGAAWFGEEQVVVVGEPPPNAGTAVHVVGADALAGAEPTEDWRLLADGVELAISGAAEPIFGTFEGGADGFDQLCRVRGSATVGGSRVEVDGAGRRATRSSLDLSRYGSIRDISAWFEPDEGLALTALRPRKAGSQAKDVIVAAVLDAAGGRPVADARLSTTYDAEGMPSRVGLELWLDEGDGGEEYPQRAAGEALPTGVLAGVGATELRAELLRCHSGGREGAGVYLLASRPR